MSSKPCDKTNPEHNCGRCRPKSAEFKNDRSRSTTKWWQSLSKDERRKFGEASSASWTTERREQLAKLNKQRYSDPKIRKIIFEKRRVIARQRPPTINSRGRRVIWDEDVGSRRLEHLVVVERFLGRKLGRGELVHHIDENKLNNNLQNLIVITRFEHAAIHSLMRGITVAKNYPRLMVQMKNLIDEVIL